MKKFIIAVAFAAASFPVFAGIVADLALDEAPEKCPTAENVRIKEMSFKVRIHEVESVHRLRKLGRQRQCLIQRQSINNQGDDHETHHHHS